MSRYQLTKKFFVDSKLCKKSLTFVCVFVFIFVVFLWPLNFTHANDFDKDEFELDLSATSACLIDVSTGRVLFQYNSEEKLPVASTTKVMTAYLALENSDLQEVVTASEEASKVEGSSIYLEDGEKLTMEEMLYGLMLDSGNDAAHAIAEHISGSKSQFSREMTDKAKKLGAKNTQFQNPHGLPEESHYSTAYDMTLITSKALQNTMFSEIVSTEKHQISKGDNCEKKRYLSNDNKILHDQEIVDGVKTGWTEKAGRCLIFSGSYQERQVVGTVLNAPDMYQDAKQLLNHGLNNFQNYTVINAGQLITFLPVEHGVKDQISVITQEDIVVPLSHHELHKLNYSITTESKLKAPIESDESIGELKVVVNDQIINSTNLIASSEVRMPLYRRFLPWFWRD